MEPLQAIILGIIQGLTEFLPVSSSGHLVIFQHLFGLNEPELFFNICVHLGTLLAVIIVFRQEIRELVRSLGHLIWLIFVKDAHFEHIFENSEFKMLLLVFFGFFPTAILGVVFHEIGQQLFSSVLIVGLMLKMGVFDKYQPHKMPQGSHQFPDFLPEDNDHRQQGSQMNANVKEELRFFQPEKMLENDQMTGAADG